MAVAEELSFAKAATRLHLSQPPLSRHIQKLEARLGVMLLHRNTRTVELTASGVVFLEDARFLLRHLDRAVDTVQRVTSEGAEVLNIGFVGAMLEEDMIEVLRGFRARHPRCQVRLHDMSGPELVAALGDRLIDGAFVGANPPRLPRELKTVLWKKDGFTVAVSVDHPLAKRKAVDLSDLIEESWVVIARGSAPTFHRHFLQLCSETGFRPRIVQESPRMAAILAMVATGGMITMLYESTARPIPQVIFLKLRKPNTFVQHSFVYRAADESAALKDLVQGLRNRHPQL